MSKKKSGSDHPPTLHHIPRNISNLAIYITINITTFMTETGRLPRFQKKTHYAGVKHPVVSHVGSQIW
jgi:hypothetical protein